MKNKKTLFFILKKNPRFFIRTGIIAILAITIAIPLILNNNNLEFFFLDIKFYITAHIINRNADISDTIAVILMDTYSEKKLDIKDVLDWRLTHPRLIEVLSQSGAALIVFDAEFRDPGLFGDEQLAEAFKRAGNVITGEFTQGATLPAFREKLSAIGDLNFTRFHSIPRKSEVSTGDESTGALSMVIAAQFIQGLQGQMAGKYITPVQLEQLRKRGHFWIHYSYPLQRFPAISYIDVLESERVPSFRNKIIIIGHYSDVNYYPHIKEKKNTGLYSHAYATENILMNTYLRKTPAADIFILIICLILIQGFYELARGKMRPVLLLCFSLLFLMGIIFLECLVQCAFSLWLHTAALFILVCITSIVHTLSTKINISRQLKVIESYREQISAYEYQQGVITGSILDDILGKITKLRTCLHVIQRESVHNSRLTKYYHLTSQNCDDVQFLLSLLKGDKALSPTPVDRMKIRDIIKELFEVPALQNRGIHLHISPLPGDFILHTDFQMLSNLIKDIFKNIVDSAQRHSTISMNILAHGDENRISFVYSGTMYPDNNLLFKQELIKKMSGNIYCTGSKSPIEITLAFPVQQHL